MPLEERGLFEVNVNLFLDGKGRGIAPKPQYPAIPVFDEAQFRFSCLFHELPSRGNPVSFLPEIDDDYFLSTKRPSGNYADGQHKDPVEPTNT